jgi:hypothetical protein
VRLNGFVFEVALSEFERRAVCDLASPADVFEVPEPTRTPVGEASITTLVATEAGTADVLAGQRCVDEVFAKSGFHLLRPRVRSRWVSAAA